MIEHLSHLTNCHGEFNSLMALADQAQPGLVMARNWAATRRGRIVYEHVELDEVRRVRAWLSQHTYLLAQQPKHLDLQGYTSVVFPSGLPLTGALVRIGAEAGTTLRDLDDILKRLVPDGIPWHRLALRLRLPEEPDDTGSAHAALALLTTGDVYGRWKTRAVTHRCIPAFIRRKLAAYGFYFPTRP